MLANIHLNKLFGLNFASIIFSVCGPFFNSLSEKKLFFDVHIFNVIITLKVKFK